MVHVANVTYWWEVVLFQKCGREPLSLSVFQIDISEIARFFFFIRNANLINRDTTVEWLKCRNIEN